MISKGKRKHICKILRERAWLDLSYKEKQRIFDENHRRLIRAASLALRVPERVLRGEA